jgi:hypothetical protein
MAVAPKVLQIQNLITTNLASGKDPKISPADHRPVSLEIIDYIDNRVLKGNNGVVFAGSKNFQTGNADDRILVEFGTGVATPDYTVIGCITSTSVGSNKPVKFWMVSDKTTTSFILLLRQVGGAPAVTSLTFEYMLFANDEV